MPRICPSRVTSLKRSLRSCPSSAATIGRPWNGCGGRSTSMGDGGAQPVAFDAQLSAGAASGPRDTHVGRLALTLALLDIDRFKDINDSFWLSFGDAALREVVSICRHILRRQTDVVARYGSDEFRTATAAHSDCCRSLVGRTDPTRNRSHSHREHCAQCLDRSRDVPDACADRQGADRRCRSCARSGWADPQRGRLR